MLYCAPPWSIQNASGANEASPSTGTANKQALDHFLAAHLPRITVQEGWWIGFLVSMRHAVHLCIANHMQVPRTRSRVTASLPRATGVLCGEAGCSQSSLVSCASILQMLHTKLTITTFHEIKQDNIQEKKANPLKESRKTPPWRKTHPTRWHNNVSSIKEKTPTNIYKRECVWYTIIRPNISHKSDFSQARLLQSRQRPECAASPA